MRNYIAVLIVSTIVLFATPCTLWSTVILPNVPAGTKYEILFVTLDTTNAASTSIGTYNAFATTEATNSPVLDALTTEHDLKWNAVVSTTTVDAVNNAPDNGIPVYNTQGQLVGWQSMEFTTTAL